MHSLRFNLTLPEDVAKLLNRKKNKSSFIADLLKEKAQAEKKLELIEKLKEGYQATRSEDLRINEDWEGALGDGID